MTVSELWDVTPVAVTDFAGIDILYFSTFRGKKMSIDIQHRFRNFYRAMYEKEKNKNQFCTHPAFHRKMFG